MVTPQPTRGAALAVLCLLILGTMPIIANSRPPDFDALGFAFALSVWQSLFALPLVLVELRSDQRGLFSATVEPRVRRRVGLVAVATGAMFGLSTYAYVLGVERAGAVNAAIAIQAYPLFAILWETLFLKRRKTPIELALTGLMITALYYLGTGGTWRIEGVSPWFLVALSVPFLWSIAHVMIKEELGSTPITPAQVTLFRVVVSALVLGATLPALAPPSLAGDMLRGDFLAFGALMGFA